MVFKVYLSMYKIAEFVEGLAEGKLFYA